MCLCHSRTSRHPKFGDIATGVFSRVLAKHSKHFSLEDALSASIECSGILNRCDDRWKAGKPNSCQQTRQR